LVYVATLLVPALAHALVIDAFTEGPLSLSGAGDLVSQTGLDPAHVVGGARYVDLYRGPVELSIADGKFSAFNPSPETDWGYFNLMYGYDTALDADFTAGGHDRIRFRFESIDPNGLDIMWVSVGTTLPPSGSAPGPGYTSIPSAGGVFEIPFSAYPNVDFTNVDTFAISVVRMRSTQGFALSEILTAGPPIAGDYNRDGFIDGSDREDWESFYHRKSSQYLGTLLGPDGNGDFVVDAADYTVWRDAYDAQQAALATPEPSVVSLAAIGASLLAFQRRQRK
jgi:hypothetical protein